MTHRPITLRLTRQEFMALNTILRHVKMGDNNPAERALSKLLIDMEEDGADTCMVECRELRLYEPHIAITASDNDGVTIVLE